MVISIGIMRLPWEPIRIDTGVPSMNETSRQLKRQARGVPRTGTAAAIVGDLVNE